MHDYANVPKELKTLSQWVNWGAVGDKARKKPYNPETARAAKANEPSTWTTFDAVCEGVAHGVYEGIGFEFNANGIVGVDFDHCFKGGQLDPWVASWVERFDSYTEISPSGDGLHILCQGTLPDKSVKRPRAEMYDRARYFTVTGNLYGTVKPLRAAQDALDALYEELLAERKKPTVQPVPAVPMMLDDLELITRAKRSKRGREFTALMDGDTSAYEGDQSRADMALCDMLAYWTGKNADQMDRIFRTSGLMRDKWDRPTAGSTYGAITIQKAIDTATQVYNPTAYFKSKTDYFVTMTESGPKKLADLHPEKNDRYAWNDIGNGNLFADWFKDQARYVPERKKWFVYNGKKWVPDIGNLRAMELCKKLADALAIYALSLPEGSQRDDYRDFVNRWQKRNNRETILKDAASVHPVQLSEFDKDPYLFNCQNGTLDLRNRSFHPHTPSDMLTMISGVHYDPFAKSPLWEKVIADTMQNDQSRAVYLQSCMGYGLTGDTSEESFFTLYGPSTRNGKGTIMETYMKMLGDYGRAARPETIAQKDKANSSAPSEDIARLAGARVVNISEPDKQMVLSAATVKTLTGRDTITARFLNENSFQYVPQFKLFINTNHLPKVTDPTIFDSGRVNVIPFERHFTEAEQDKGLKRKLAKKENLSAILNWCLDGLWQMQETGLTAPESVKQATAQYRQDSDKIARFVGEMMEPDITGEIRTEEAYQRYQEWCMRNGQHAEGMPGFKRAMEAHAEIRKKRPNGAGREASKISLILGLQWQCGPEWSGIL